MPPTSAEKRGVKKSLWSKMSGIQMVCQVIWLYHLNTVHSYCPVFRWSQYSDGYCACKLKNILCIIFVIWPCKVAGPGIILQRDVDWNTWNRRIEQWLEKPSLRYLFLLLLVFEKYSSFRWIFYFYKINSKISQSIRYCFYFQFIFDFLVMVESGKGLGLDLSSQSPQIGAWYGLS